MLYSIIVYYIMLCYVILCYIILYYIILYYIILYYIILYYIILYYIIYDCFNCSCTLSFELGQFLKNSNFAVFPSVMVLANCHALCSCKIPLRFELK